MTGPVYIHIDLDCLDPTRFGHTPFREADGLHPTTSQRCCVDCVATARWMFSASASPSRWRPTTNCSPSGSCSARSRHSSTEDRHPSIRRDSCRSAVAHGRLVAARGDERPDPARNSWVTTSSSPSPVAHCAGVRWTPAPRASSSAHACSRRRAQPMLRPFLAGHQGENADLLGTFLQLPQKERISVDPVVAWTSTCIVGSASTKINEPRSLPFWLP